MPGWRLTVCAVVFSTAWPVLINAQRQRTYVGWRACGDCHEAETVTFEKFATKRHSYDAVRKMARELSAQDIKGCYTCHTTGYGKPGGFVSVESTPHLADCGCEVCHGPGSAHVDSGKIADIVRTPDPKVCHTCHTDSRIEAFQYRPLRYGGAH